MTDVDTLLSRIRHLPLDARVETIDEAVMARVAAARPSPVSVSAGAMTLVAVLSLAMGVVSAIVPAQRVQAATTLPLGTPAALAPSSLLGAGR